jgi:predicted amidohydrolase
MKIAAYQAPLLPAGSMAALELIRARVRWCETEGVDILCCPEAVLGGLADDAESPRDFAIGVESGQLQALLAPLASKSVTAIVGFTEAAGAGKLYKPPPCFTPEGSPASTASAILRSEGPCIAQGIKARSSPPARFRSGS